MKKPTHHLQANGRAWVLQVILSFAIGIFFLLPIWIMTFQNGHRPISTAQATILVFFTLLPIWLLQLVAFRFAPPEKRLRRWLILLGAYCAGLGPVLAIAVRISEKWKKNQFPYILRVAVVFAFCTIAMNLLFSIYAVIVFGTLSALLVR
jgi:hypothetical protein